MAETGLFPRLKRLFSSDVVIRNVGGTQLKVFDVNKIQQSGTIETNSLIDRFNRIHTNRSTSLYGIQNNINYQTLRPLLYSEYDAMDTDAIVSSALDIIADESTLKSDMGEVLSIRSTDENIQNILYNLFYDILNIEFNLWPWVRNLCKYGDFFLKLEIAEKFGVYNVIPYTAFHIERLEGADEERPLDIKFRFLPEGISASSYGYYNIPNSKDLNNPNAIYFENYEIAHFRLLSDMNFLPYGRCLHPESKVYTENSIKEIQHISKGDKVWTFNIEENKYELANVLNTINSGIKKIYSVKTVHNEIKGSDNHPILVWNFHNEKPEYKQIKYLKVNDYVCTYKNIDFNLSNPKLDKTSFEIGPYDWKCKLDSIDAFPERITPEFARFWGFMLGDGWENPTNHSIGFSRGINNERNQYYENLLKKYSGKENLSNISSLTSKVNPSGVVVNSKMFHHLMTINGYVGKSYSKRLPKWIYECDEITQLSLVKGLMDADGYIFEDKWNCNSYNLTLNNKMMLNDLKYLLDRLKIKTGNIRPRKWNGKCNILGVEYNSKQSYDFTFYLDGKRKQQYVKFDSINPKYNFELYKIKSITEELPEETYDIQVDRNSNFITNGIIVHNSFIEPARKLFKSYALMEDSMLIHRIVRAPEKRIFYLNIGSIPPNEIDGFMEKTIGKLKRTPYVDEQTGDYNLRYNLQNLLEDYYIPIRGNDSNTKIENLNGLQWDGIKDVEYLRDKLFAALKIPKAFMGYEANTGGKATLASQDVRFARTIERIQRIITSELYKIALVHLYSQGFNDENLANFELSLTNPSIIYDQERVALLKEKVDLATNMLETKLLPTDWIYENLFHFSEDQYDEYRELIREDQKRAFRWKQIFDEGNDPTESGRSYGTPHDLASLYGKGEDPGAVPEGYDENVPLGRPEEKVTNINTQYGNFGKDRLGKKGRKRDYNDPINKSPLALEMLKHQRAINAFSSKLKKPRKIIFESNNLLDESNIKE